MEREAYDIESNAGGMATVLTREIVELVPQATAWRMYQVVRSGRAPGSAPALSRALLGVVPHRRRHGCVADVLGAVFGGGIPTDSGISPASELREAEGTPEAAA